MELNIPASRLLQVAENYGTPLYVYDAETIRNQIKKLKTAFSALPAKFHYAAKALTNIQVLKMIQKEGLGLDAVSIQEVNLGLLAGFLPQDILFTPNCISFSELEEAISLGVRINIDSLPILEQFGNQYGSQYSVTLRINPHILAGGNFQISTGHIDSKFGISMHQMRHLLRLVNIFNIHVEGLHMHTGSDIINVDVFLRGASILFEEAFNFPDLKYLDFGSGFKVAYKQDDNITNITELGEKMAEKYEKFTTKYGREIEIWFEPGKYIVSEAGYFLARVNIVKQTTATVFAGLDTGFNHLIRPTLYQAYHHITNLSNLNGKLKIYSVVGYVCETDTFAWDRQIQEMKEGDILCFHNAGAYGFMMASNYNSRLRPAEVLVDGPENKLIRRRENLNDLLNTQGISAQLAENN